MKTVSPLHLACLAFGAIVLGHALQIRNGFYDPVALSWTLLAAVLVLAGVGRIPGPRLSEPVVAGVLTAGVLTNLLVLATMPIGLYLPARNLRATPSFWLALPSRRCARS